MSETTLRLLQAITRRHDDLAVEALQLYYKATSGALTVHDIRQAELSVLALVQLVRRIDAEAAAYLESDIVPRLRIAATNRALTSSPSTAANEAAVDAVSVIEGALEATYIDGPAQGATAVHVTAVAAAQADAQAQASATATAEAVMPEIDAFLEQARGSVGEEVLREIAELREAVEAGESTSSLLPRFIRVLDSVRSVSGLATSLIELGTRLFG